MVCLSENCRQLPAERISTIVLILSWSWVISAADYARVGCGLTSSICRRAETRLRRVEDRSGDLRLVPAIPGPVPATPRPLPEP
jgi:hypothetical protein